MAFKKHEVTLQYRFKNDSNSFDIVACMKGIRAGIEHLHSFGFAHNNLNLMDIALDSNYNTIILDFGSCRQFGEQLFSTGTYGWIEEDLLPLHNDMRSMQ
jgi:serine/threonine protein kinase